MHTRIDKKALFGMPQLHTHAWSYPDCVWEPLRLYQAEHTKYTRTTRRKQCEIDEVVAASPPELLDALPFYKVVSGMLERQVDMRYYTLLTFSELWVGALPGSHKTIEHQVLAFDLCNEAGSLVLENLGPRRTRAPQVLFHVDMNAAKIR